MRTHVIQALTLGLLVAGCPSRESVGTRTINILGAGVVNNPANKSLRFDLLKYGLTQFCAEMLRGSAPLRLRDDEPVIGRFFADSCQSQVIDDEHHKSFVVQYQGRGYAWTNLTGRLGFAVQGLVEYAPDFQLQDGAMYVYFRTKMVDSTAFQTLMVESKLAETGLSVTGVNPDEVGRNIVDSQLHRGFTVIRYNAVGETELAMGIIPKGAQPFKPFRVESSDRRTLSNERTEVHQGQQDFLGTLSVTEDKQALFFTAQLDGTPAVDLVLLPKAAGLLMLDRYIRTPGAAPLPIAPLFADALLAGQPLKRYLNVPPGEYLLLVDHSPVVGTSAPQAGFDERAGKVDTLVLLGDRP